MDNRLVFEQNLDTILVCLDREAKGIRLREFAFANVVGNVAILVSQLVEDQYIVVTEIEQRMLITHKGKKFLHRKGGYVQTKMNSKLHSKPQKPFWGFFKTIEETLSLVLLLSLFFSTTAMLCTCLFIFECYRFVVK